jgi:hypothetical protein
VKRTGSSAPRNNRNAWLAWILFAIVILGTLLNFMYDRDNPGVPNNAFSFLNALLNALWWIAFGAVGALILGRYPRHAIGWLLMFIALSGAVLGSVEKFLAQMVSATSEPTFTALFVLWFGGWAWWLFLGPLLLILLLFPTGRLISPRWRWVVILLAITFSGFLLFATISPTLGSLPNPLGLIPEAFPLEFFLVPFYILLTTTVLSCVASVFLRYRRAAAVEREQLKWFLYAGGVFLLVFLSGFFINQDGPPGVWAILFDLAVLTIPLSIGIAILRYRLWDIDVLIRKTLIYAVLTSALALVYFGSVVLLQQAFGAVTGTENSPVVTILSTLAIAALFTPLRRYIQNFIDRLFYRRKYDAQKILEGFASSVRNEVELEQLTARLLSVVEETMQPESVSLWLKADKKQ